MIDREKITVAIADVVIILAALVFCGTAHSEVWTSQQGHNATVWAPPPPGPDCTTNITADDRIEQHLDWTAGAEVADVLTGFAAFKWTRAYNDRPPKSTFKLDKIVAFTSSVYGGRYLVVLIRDGCVVDEGPMDITVFDELKLGLGRNA